MLTIQWTDILAPQSKLAKDGTLFCCHIYNIKDAVGNPVMRELATFALKLYSLPISNAARAVKCFLAKTLRNRMSLKLLDFILIIKIT